MIAISVTFQPLFSVIPKIFSKFADLYETDKCSSSHYTRRKSICHQRGYGEFKDWWEFPGGKGEPGETLEQALRREIREELDTEISVDSFITTVDYDYPAFHLTMHCYWCSILSGNLELKEHEAAKWLAPDELESVNWLPAMTVIFW